MSCTLHYQQLEDITEEDISNAQPTHVLDTYSRILWSHPKILIISLNSLLKYVCEWYLVLSKRKVLTNCQSQAQTKLVHTKQNVYFSLPIELLVCKMKLHVHALVAKYCLQTTTKYNHTVALDTHIS